MNVPETWCCPPPFSSLHRLGFVDHASPVCLVVVWQCICRFLFFLPPISQCPNRICSISRCSPLPHPFPIVCGNCRIPNTTRGTHCTTLSLPPTHRPIPFLWLPNPLCNWFLRVGIFSILSHGPSLVPSKIWFFFPCRSHWLSGPLIFESVHCGIVFVFEHCLNCLANF